MQANIPAFMGVAAFILVTPGPDTALVTKKADHRRRAPPLACLLPFLLLGGLFVAMTVTWLSGYALMAAKAGGLLTRPRVKAALDRITGFVLVALGLRLATESR